MYNNYKFYDDMEQILDYLWQFLRCMCIVKLNFRFVKANFESIQFSYCKTYELYTVASCWLELGNFEQPRKQEFTLRRK